MRNPPSANETLVLIMLAAFLGWMCLVGMMGLIFIPR